MKTFHLPVAVLVLQPIVGAGAAALPDPTRPADYSETVNIVQQQDEGDVNFNLTAIRIDPDRRSAIINGKLVRQGQTVDSATVLEIHPAHVVLDHENRRLEVRLFNELTRKINDSSAQMEISN